MNVMSRTVFDSHCHVLHGVDMSLYCDIITLCIIFLPNIGTVMKKSFLILGCIVTSSLCLASCEKSQQGIPSDYFTLRDNCPHGLYTINDVRESRVNEQQPSDCPVSPVKKKSPSKNRESVELDDNIGAFVLYSQSCPVSPVKK